MDPALSIWLTGSLALVLGRACLHKAADPSHFRSSLAAYEILPTPAHPLAATCLIAFEALAALSLAGGIVLEGLRPIGSVAALLLLTVYSGAIALSLLRGRRDLDCGCDGPGKSRPISPALLARNAVLMAVAVLGAIPPQPRQLFAIDVFSIVFALAAFGLLYETLNHLGQTARSPFSSPAPHARRVS